MSKEAMQQAPVAWLITDEKINSLQVDSIQRLIDRARHAHMTDIKLRINGQDEWFQADWLKHLTRTTLPQRACPVCDQVHSILDVDESRIIRNAKDGYPGGRPPRALTLQERVMALCRYAADWKRWCLEKENTPPPQRTWVGLTDEERIMCRSYDPEEAVAKTEAKLKEKNT